MSSEGVTGSQGVAVSGAGGVRRIALDRPARRNAVDPATAAALHRAILDARDDPECSVLVLAGNGPVFCAGWDLDSLGELVASGEDALRAAFAQTRALLEDLAAAPQATVAEVRGGVLGFGIGLVGACDLAVASETTVVALPEIAHGIVPGMVMLDLLGRVPEKVALDWLLTGERRSAADALAAGLVSRVVPDAELEPTVDALAKRLAAHDPAVLRATKRAYRELAALPREHATEVAIEGAVRALLERP